MVKRVSSFGRGPRGGRIIVEPTYDGPNRFLSFLGHFVPGPKVLVLLAAVGYVMVFGWPSIQTEYQYQQIGGERYKTSCRYWNPAGTFTVLAESGECPFLIGGQKRNGH